MWERQGLSRALLASFLAGLLGLALLAWLGLACGLAWLGFIGLIGLAAVAWLGLLYHESYQ